MKRVEKIGAISAIVGIIMSLMLITGGHAVLGLALIVLAAIYYPLGFFYFNSISISEIFKKESYKGITLLNGILSFIAGFTFSFSSIGILFKLLLLPGANNMLIIGLASTVILLIIFILTLFIKKWSELLRSILLRTIIWIPLSLALYIIPEITLVKVFFRDEPEFIENYMQSIQKLNSEESNFTNE